MDTRSTAPRWTGAFVWALVAASAVAWSLRIAGAARPVPEGATLPRAGAASDGPMERLFGTTPRVVAAPPGRPDSARLRLVGVIAPRFALLEIDGHGVRTWPVGATLADGVVLLSLGKRTARFGPLGGPPEFTLELPVADAGATPVGAAPVAPTLVEASAERPHRRSGPRHVGRSHSTRRHGGANVDETPDPDASSEADERSS